MNTLKDQAGQTTASTSADFFRKSLVTAQVAISLVLLICAGLFLRSLVNLTSIDLGIRTDHLLGFSVYFVAEAEASTPMRRRCISTNSSPRRLGAIPRSDAGLGLCPPFPALQAGSSTSSNITVEGYTAPTEDAADCSHQRRGPRLFPHHGGAAHLGPRVH